MSVDVIFKIFLPDRALGLTERTRGLRDAFHELKVRVRRNWQFAERLDLFFLGILFLNILSWF